MIESTAEYIRLEPGVSLPAVGSAPPYRAVVIVEAPVSTEWQASASDWLVRSGCLYMMAWGTNCSSWDDSVDFANIDQFLPAEAPDDKFVMTTWHEHELLEEVFWFAKNSARHPTVQLERTVLVHISSQSREESLLKVYADA
ncbi:hypothetical protein H8K35_10440 [Undibacterium sp. LX40W]|uniref:DUF7684 domain-containing protein n=1 Tax=Undibacterium nitidum TaxID=2762298 RepID=A0A923KT56_9BURK|nr:MULTISPECIES: hypothetical protein [Undibacterium]MBC3881926.1 hypothetical protein [Undibacterium nitidum]MBC3892077.1 hypothetical protein [Undibacterium sp. LX40W]